MARTQGKTSVSFEATSKGAARRGKEKSSHKASIYSPRASWSEASFDEKNTLVRQGSERESAVLKIQAHARGRNARKRMEIMRTQDGAARKIQSQARKQMQEKKKKDHAEAAKRSLKILEEEKADREMREKEAASISIQSAFRARAGKKKAAERKKRLEELRERQKAADQRDAEEAAALLIQQLVRRRAAKIEMRKRREAHEAQLAEAKTEEDRDRIREAQERELASMQLQSAWRARTDRQRVKKMRKERDERRKKAAEDAQAALEHDAAAKIQTMYRIWRDKKRIVAMRERLAWEKENVEEARRQREEAKKREKEEKEFAATKMQAMFRSRAARLEVEGREKSTRPRRRG